MGKLFLVHESGFVGGKALLSNTCIIYLLEQSNTNEINRLLWRITCCFDDTDVGMHEKDSYFKLKL